MTKIKNSTLYENVLTINRTYRFRNPQAVIRTWYGIKVISGKTFRFYTFDKEILKELLESLKLDKRL